MCWVIFLFQKLHANIQEIAWPNKVEESDLQILKDGSVRLVSEDEYAVITVGANRRHVTVEYLAKVSHRMSRRSLGWLIWHIIPVWVNSDDVVCNGLKSPVYEISTSWPLKDSQRLGSQRPIVNPQKMHCHQSQLKKFRQEFPLWPVRDFPNFGRWYKITFTSQKWVKLEQAKRN